MLFGLVRVNSELFFARRNRQHLRGHKYVLDKQRCNSIGLLADRVLLAQELLMYGITCLIARISRVCAVLIDRSAAYILSKYCKVIFL